MTKDFCHANRGHEIFFFLGFANKEGIGHVLPFIIRYNEDLSCNLLVMDSHPTPEFSRTIHNIFSEQFLPQDRMIVNFRKPQYAVAGCETFSMKTYMGWLRETVSTIDTVYEHQRDVPGRIRSMEIYPEYFARLTQNDILFRKFLLNGVPVFTDPTLTDRGKTIAHSEQKHLKTLEKNQTQTR